MRKTTFFVAQKSNPIPLVFAIQQNPNCLKVLHADGCVCDQMQDLILLELDFCFLLQLQIAITLKYDSYALVNEYLFLPYIKQPGSRAVFLFISFLSFTFLFCFYVFISFCRCLAFCVAVELISHSLRILDVSDTNSGLSVGFRD